LRVSHDNHPPAGDLLAAAGWLAHRNHPSLANDTRPSSATRPPRTSKRTSATGPASPTATPAGRDRTAAGGLPQAERRYQAALTTAEERGDRAGIARVTSQLGIFHTVQGRPAEGVRYNLGALVLRLEIGSPDASTDMFWLAKQRQETGVEAFTQILGELLDADSVKFVIDALNGHPKPRQVA
jgi:hypothetical protein